MYNGLCVAMDRIYKKSQELGGNCTPIIFVLTDGDSNTGYKFSETKDIIAGMNIPIYTISYNYAADSLSELASINEAASIVGNSEDITYSSATCLTQRCNFKARFYPRSCSKKDSLHAASSGQRETLPANRLSERKVGYRYASTTGSELSLFHPLRRLRLLLYIQKQRKPRIHPGIRDAGVS